MEIRPALYRAGRAITGQDAAGRDLADSIYAELYGVSRGASASGEPRSLFRYDHERSTVATWVRAVLAKRHVDQIRAARRVVPTEGWAARTRHSSPVSTRAVWNRTRRSGG